MNNRDFAQFIADLGSAGIADGVVLVPVAEATVDAMWEACTFLRDTEAGLKPAATALLRDVLNAAV